MNSLSAREQKKEEIKKSRAGSITEGVIWKQLLLFFFPILFGTFFQQLYNTVEMCIRDRYRPVQNLYVLPSKSPYRRSAGIHMARRNTDGSGEA